MKKQILKSVVGTLLASLTIAGGMPVSASENDQEPRQRSIVGAWRVFLTPRDCATGNAIPVPGAPFQGLYSFHRGGTMSEWLTNANVLPTQRSPGHGDWRKTSGRHNYGYSIIFNRYDALGTLTGTQQGHAELVLGESGNDYTATSSVQVFNLEGTLLVTSCATIQGIRYQ